MRNGSVPYPESIVKIECGRNGRKTKKGQRELRPYLQRVIAAGLV